MKTAIGIIAILIITWLLWPSPEWKVDGVWFSNSAIEIDNNNCTWMTFHGLNDTYSAGLTSLPTSKGTYYVDGDDIILDNGTVLKFETKNNLLYITVSGKVVKFAQSIKDLDASTTSDHRL